MDGWIGRQFDELRRIEAEGYSPSGVLAPFHDALVPGIRGLGERGFSTALGNLHERIALVLAAEAHSEARRAFDLSGTLPVLAREFITQRINQLIRGEAAPDHLYERGQLLGAFGDEVAATTRVDLFVRMHGGGDSPATHDSLIGLYRDVGLEYRSELDELRTAIADVAG